MFDEKGNLRAWCLGGWDPRLSFRCYTATIRLKLARSQALNQRGVGTLASIPYHHANVQERIDKSSKQFSIIIKQ